MSQYFCPRKTNKPAKNEIQLNCGSTVTALDERHSTRHQRKNQRCPNGRRNHRSLHRRKRGTFERCRIRPGRQLQPERRAQPVHIGLLVHRIQDVRDKRLGRHQLGNRHCTEERRHTTGRNHHSGHQSGPHGSRCASLGAQGHERGQRDERQEHRAVAGHHRGQRHTTHVGGHRGTQQQRRRPVCHPARHGQTVQLHAGKRSQDTQPGQREPLRAA